MVLVLSLLACAPSSITLGNDGNGPAVVIDDDTAGDTGTDRPCAFIDDWIPDMKLPSMSFYRYTLTGCGVVQGCTCDDATIADASIESTGFLDGSQGDVVLVVSAWIAGSTSCTCTVVDYDHYDDYSSSYDVSVESTE